MTTRIIYFGITFSLALCSSSCQTLRAPKDTSEAKELPQYWLSTSLYAGRFYDDDKRYLVDFRPFSTIDDVQTVDGYILYPPPPERTITAGTLVKIDHISYPDDKTRMRRPIYSPRDNVWVYLVFAKERGRVNMFREREHILVLPKAITTERQVQGYLSRFLSTKDPNRWILQQESKIQDGIFEKRAVTGMKREHVIAALGPANKKQFNHHPGPHEPEEVWHYETVLVEFSDDVVSKIRNLTPTKLSAKGR